VVRVLSLALVVALLATGVASADRGDPQERFTPSDQARARAMLIRGSDLSPAYAARPAARASADYCAALDESDLTLTGRGNSPNFTAATEYLTSSSSVYATRSDSDASWVRGTSKAGEQCLRQAVRAALQGTVVRLVSFKRVPFPKRGARSVAYRALATIEGVRVYMDVVAMQVSRAQASVFYVSALVPAPAAELRRLSAVVAKRAANAMRGS